MHTAVRTVAAAALSLATTASLATALTVPAQAAGSTAQAWAAFATAPSWVKPADNVQWYVASGALPKSALGTTVKLTVTSPATIDCANLGAGYGTDAGWTNIAPRHAACTATRASWAIKVTKDMVGKELSLNGWTAAGSATTVTVKGTVAVRGSVAKVSSTARKTVAPAPVGPLVALGTWNGQQVSTATGNLVNEVWLGTGTSAKRWAAPDGALWHSSLDGSLVNLWYQDGQQLNHWQLNLVTGATTSQVVASPHVILTGKPGFWAQSADHLSANLYDWSGNLRKTTGYTPTSMHAVSIGFSDTHSISLDRYPYTWVGFQPLDGTPLGYWNLGSTHPMSAWRVDATGVTVDYRTDQGGTATCHIAWGTSDCPGSWGVAKA